MPRGSTGRSSMTGTPLPPPRPRSQRHEARAPRSFPHREAVDDPHGRARLPLEGVRAREQLLVVRADGTWCRNGVEAELTWSTSAVMLPRTEALRRRGSTDIRPCRASTRHAVPSPSGRPCAPPSSAAPRSGEHTRTDVLLQLARLLVFLQVRLALERRARGEGHVPARGGGVDGRRHARAAITGSGGSAAPRMTDARHTESLAVAVSLAHNRAHTTPLRRTLTLCPRAPSRARTRAT